MGLMKKLTLIILSLFLLLFSSSCQSKKEAIIGSWYCAENDVLLTFYEDQSFDRKLVGFKSFYDGTYKWTLDSKNMLKISDLTGKTLSTFKWNIDKNTDTSWNLKSDLIIGKHIYINTNGEKITEDDISPEFLENNTNFCCTVFLINDSVEKNMQNLHDILLSREEVKNIKYISPDNAWEEFQNQYFEGNEDAAKGFADDNPVLYSEHFEVYTHTEQELNSLVEYLKTLNFVGNINISDTTIKNDFLL